jgi:hypothetical protein
MRHTSIESLGNFPQGPTDFSAVLNVRFCRLSGHQLGPLECPLWATNGQPQPREPPRGFLPPDLNATTIRVPAARRK